MSKPLLIIAESIEKEARCKRRHSSRHLKVTWIATLWVENRWLPATTWEILMIPCINVLFSKRCCQIVPTTARFKLGLCMVMYWCLLYNPWQWNLRTTKQVVDCRYCPNGGKKPFRYSRFINDCTAIIFVVYSHCNETMLNMVGVLKTDQLKLNQLI